MAEQKETEVIVTAINDNLMPEGFPSDLGLSREDTDPSEKHGVKHRFMERWIT